MSEKKEKLIIVGHSGSGKDFLREQLVNFGLKYNPKFTTRPKRINETNGIEYDFIDYDLYVKLHKDGFIKTSECFNIKGVNWYYGVTIQNWNENQVFIMTPSELAQLSETDRKNCFVVYLKIDESIREKRILERNDNNDSVKRRIEADEKDFEFFKNYDLCLTDSEFEPKMVFDLMY